MSQLIYDTLIIGGGISGLSLLHFLNESEQATQTLLLEACQDVGGTIVTDRTAYGVFEHGPNGFLDNKPTTLELIKALGLESDIVTADTKAKIRYVATATGLEKLPQSPGALFKFAPLSFFDKLRFFGDLLFPPGSDPHVSVYDFVKRRFGAKIADYIVDPMITGIYGGNAKAMGLRAVFPRMADIERKYGSLILAMIAQRRHARKSGKASGMFRGQLTSLRNGMAQVPKTLYKRHASSIQSGQSARSIRRINDHFEIVTQADDVFQAKHVVLSVPAFVAADCLQSLDESLAEHLRQIAYAPMAVVGLTYRRDQLESVIPPGFGYLNPSCLGRPVLGVLFEHQLFPDRSDPEYGLLRVMIGGVHHPQWVLREQKDIIDLAREELQERFDLMAHPITSHCRTWPKGIPQYHCQYPGWQAQAKTQLATISPNIHFHANYWHGVSFNDCIEHAQRLAEQLLSSLQQTVSVLDQEGKSL